jgi:dephospho-CoA kinase
MLKVGITGGIGSGKTTVCQVFETLGIPVFYADQIAKQLIITDAILIAGVKETFGEESYYSTGVLNNKHIANIVFENKEELDKLNALVHPAVFRAFNDWAKSIPRDIPYTLKEAALLFESGSYQMCDINILVKAPLELKLSRVMQRDQVSAAQVLARMDKQFTDEQKIKMADFLIENDERTSIIEQVLHLHQQFLARSE